MSKTVQVSKQQLMKLYGLPEQNAASLMNMLSDAAAAKVKVGRGLFSKALDLATKTANVVQTSRELTGKIATRAPKNPDWDYKPKSGENHAVVKRDGYFYRTKFAGPGTHLIDDIKEGIAKHGSLDEMIKPEHYVTKMDLEGLVHDIRYMLAPLFPDPKKAVLAADERFVEVGKRLLKDPVEAVEPLNVQGSLGPILAKHLSDLAGTTDPLSFLDKNADGTLKKPTEEERKLGEEVLNKLSQKGYGISKDRPERPADKIYCSLGCGRLVKPSYQSKHQESKVCRQLRSIS